MEVFIKNRIGLPIQRNDSVKKDNKEVLRDSPKRNCVDLTALRANYASDTSDVWALFIIR